MLQSLYGGLCVWTEARDQLTDGRAAVALAIKNRTALRFRSDGTTQGTVLWPSQFDDFWFDYVDRTYQRVCFTAEEAEARAEQLFKRALGDKSLQACQAVFDQVAAGSYRGGPEYQKLTDHTVMFLNPNLVKRPPWATPDKLDAVIGPVEFYRA